MNKFIEIIGVLIGVIAIIVIVALVLAVPTWLLWNWIAPIFSLPPLTLLQSLGLLLLTSILFRSSTTKSS